MPEAPSPTDGDGAVPVCSAKATAGAADHDGGVVDALKRDTNTCLVLVFTSVSQAATTAPPRVARDGFLSSTWALSSCLEMTRGNEMAPVSPSMTR